MTIINRLAIDISHYNGPADWGAIWAAGVRCAILKASESNNAKDDKYDTYLRDIKASGHDFLIGAYHFGRGTDPKSQVDWFFKCAQPTENMGLFFDWEVASVTVPIARAFLEECDKRWGKYTSLYSYQSFLNEHLGTKPDTFFGLHPLWFAAYGSSPRDIQPSWQKYFLWQYSDGQVGPQPRTCPGITGDTDEDSFDGAEADLRGEWDAWMKTGLPGVNVVAPPPPAQPTNVGGDRKPLFDIVRTFALGKTLAQRQVNQLDATLNGWKDDGTSRLLFFNLVRDMTAYGRFTQSQVDSLDAALDEWVKPSQKG